MDPFVFPWDVPVHQLTGITGRSTNTVAQVGLVNPTTGELYPLMHRKPNDPMHTPYDMIVFSMIAIRNGDERSKAQRYLKPKDKYIDYCVLALTSGIAIATGSPNACVAYESLMAAARIMRRELLPGNDVFQLVCLNIVNMPYCGYFEDFGIDLAKFTSMDSPYSITWENDTFPGAITRTPPETTTITVFASGMLICTGETAVAMMPRIQRLVDFIHAHPEIHVPLSKEDIEKREKKIRERHERIQMSSTAPVSLGDCTEEICKSLDIPM